MRARRGLKGLAWGLVVAVAASSAAIGLRRMSGNFGVVVPGQVYRSAQMSAGQLAATLRDRRIKSVLNLRGANIDAAWYRAEREATLRAESTQVDVAMASDQWMSRDQARAVVEILDRCESPVLIHCEWGAERTGLVSAFAELLRPGSTIQGARGQFSVRYLFLPIRDGLVMRGHLDRYAAWLAGRGEIHSPGRFREWVAAGYRPGRPCRETWPYDPYPLVVVTRPAGTGTHHDTRPQTRRVGSRPSAHRRR